MILPVDTDLSLEMVDIQHAEPIFKLVNSNRWHLREWLPWVTKMETLEHFKEYIATTHDRFSNNHDHAFVIIQNGDVVGRIGIYNIDSTNHIGAIGYWIGNEFQGKGIVTKSCKTLLNYCFSDLELNRVEIRCATKNFRSQAVPERLGFTKEGIIRQGEALRNEYIDIYCYSLLKHEWK